MEITVVTVTLTRAPASLGGQAQFEAADHNGNESTSPCNTRSSNASIASALALILLLPLAALGQVRGSAKLSVVTVANNTVLWNSTHQTIDGFGGGLGFDTSTAFTSTQADLIFTTLGMSVLRNMLTPDNEYANVASMQLAQARGAKVWTVSATPPAAWKGNGSLIQGSLLQSHYADFANYIVTYIQTLSSTYGINLYAFSIQNEPDFVGANYESALWTDQQLHDFLVNNLGPAFSAAGLTTKIIVPETGQWNNLHSWADKIIADPSADAYVSIYAAHDYDSAFDPQPNVPANKHLWETEISALAAGDTSINGGLIYAQNAHNLLTGASVNAWHIFLVSYGSDCSLDPFICNGTATKAAYTIANFSKFVHPGWVRLDAVTNFAGVFISAYKEASSGKFAIVAINANGSATPISLSFNGFTSSTVIPNITDATLDLAAQSGVAAGGGFSYTLPATSVVTFTGTDGT